MQRKRGPVLAVIGSMVGLLASTTAGFSADNGTVDAEVTVAQAAACIELSASSISFGILALGAEDAPGTPGITVTNCGDAGLTLFASGTDAAGQGAAWTLDDTATTCVDTLGLDAYHLGLATPAGAAIAALSTENKELGALDGAATTTQVARISTACPGSTGAGQSMSMHINYLATNVVVPPIVLEALPATQENADAAAAYLLPASKDYDVPATCSGNFVACTGGVPSNPLPQLQIQATNVASVQVPATTRWNTSATLGVATLQPIPATVSGVTCNITVNSANGAQTTFAGTADLNFQSYPDPLDPTNYVAATNVNVTGVESADLSLTGGFACDFADAFKSSFIPQLVDQMEAYIAGNICGDPASTGFIPCPILP
ncbi:MAG TPA: hypothetical protein VFP56_12050 [Candidatus Limnocylindrales bacterium]|nr:hypothetical protein [Candidatus Limnocylindrales bacterium]